MKLRAQIIFFLAALLLMMAVAVMRRGNGIRPQSNGACCPFTLLPDSQSVARNTNQAVTNAAAHTVTAYYFHGTVRCETCLLIEALARAVVEQQFGADLAAKRLIWESVNYDLPENRHFLTDYKLTCPSLVLVLRQEGKPERWKLLADTWQLVHEPDKLISYVESEVRNFLDWQEQPIGPNQAGVLHSPNDL
ncbi:nitrophenyl compound nitroreductase subunit ArsF family protein [Limisphaera sp. 4302-co]|uniref:nitrophenyl compound nitroreductase subunit ArsF family protein n=1 Tax=Limisphaera sp. 4302-co TaxID=3400417 RepID=UPI003C1D79AD